MKNKKLGFGFSLLSLGGLTAEIWVSSDILRWSTTEPRIKQEILWKD